MAMVPEMMVTRCVLCCVAASARAERGGRQAWPGVLGAGPCFSTQGRLGQCTSFRACYPYFKLPDFSTWETWVLGVFDTCSYFGESGRQVSATIAIAQSRPVGMRISAQVCQTAQFAVLSRGRVL